MAYAGRRDSPMLVLTLDAALAGCSAGLVRDGVLVAERRVEGARGLAGVLPAMADSVLADAGVSAADLDLVAVTVGPGSFTGLRAALSLAHGIALGAGVSVLGVTVGAALAEPSDGREQWTAVDTRRGRVFLEIGSSVRSTGLADMAVPRHPVTISGDAAPQVAEHLAAQGADVRLGHLRPSPPGIAAAALRRQSAGLAPLPAQPLYVDPPEARPAA